PRPGNNLYSMNKHYHFIGIGGIGMSGIAHLFLCRGYGASGSDVKDSAILSQLKELGAQIYIGHRSENIKNADVVVYSSAISNDNPEIIEAIKKGIPIIKRAQALAELMVNKDVVAIAGSHGKTTTTSLASCLLLEAGLSPTAVIGGILKNIGMNACSGQGDFFVAEADESDGSFLYYQPKYSIITNIDREHLDYYNNFDNEIEAFRQFVAKTKNNGCVFACADDLNLRNILERYGGRKIFFGLNSNADVYAKNVKLNGLTSEFDCFSKNKFVDRFYLSLGGEHNISNSLAVIALGLELGISLDIIKKALKNFKGAKRRLEIKFSDDDYLFIDDYAHHPSEIKATLSAAANLARKRVVAIFQPHRYSRTKLLLDDFSKSFAQADCVIITDIYPASELPIPGIDGKLLYNKIKDQDPGKEVYFLARQEIQDFVARNMRSGDLVLTLGAGDIVKIGEELVAKFTRQSLVR
ncbi:MAG: UDP-N-acetylmuramate--L-alanine ligase, partial [Candidatus Omnitrophota bacterium]